MTLTKSWLQKAISDIETMRDEIPFGLDEDGNNTLAALKMALAGMETEPVFKINHDSSLIKHVKKVVRETSAPQPLTTSERAELENYRNAQQVVPEAYVTAEHRRVIGMLLGVCGAAFELADDSCQQDVDGEECHVVPADSFKKLSDALGEIENTLPDEYQDLPDTVLQWAAVPRHALQAMLQGKAPQQLGGPSGVHAKVNNGHHVGAGDGSYGRAGDDLSARGMGGTGCDNTAPQPENESE